MQKSEDNILNKILIQRKRFKVRESIKKLCFFALILLFTTLLLSSDFKLLIGIMFHFDFDVYGFIYRVSINYREPGSDIIREDVFLYRYMDGQWVNTWRKSGKKQREQTTGMERF